MNKQSKLTIAYALLVVGLLLVIFAAPLADSLIPWANVYHSGNVTQYTRNDAAINFWTSGFRYLGFFMLALGFVERVLHAIEMRSNSS
ncbi:hypothetical protein B1R32_104152 [Abditibacterium utsteinense]|uniref:Uncharacterized protein n=1 Tax=Abditibacterium utsteinense TaxID=1960156 RepID=A0A2S8SV27_9BACT|nr:hypothetical protein [Abditibacterium utsteinense]PQV64658.1 hypothetical protein B1R32_104152 [Abditibacterium utsteinense]